MEAVVRPTPAQLAQLSRFERLAFRLVDFVNSHELTKASSQVFLRSVGMSWVWCCTRNLIHMVGVRHVRELRPERGLLLCSNHRSFFDQYVISCCLFKTTRLLERIYFPVRAEFWYQRPLGVGVSLAMSALSMYPPVFREQGKREFNHYGLKRLVQLLAQPGSVVGMHPEGTRGKGPDPYTLLPAQPGIGKLIMEARPTVLPIFVNGLSNRFVQQVRSNFDGTGAPIVIVFGAPLALARFYERKNTLRTQKELAEHVLAEIAALGARERAHRAELAASPARGPRVHD
jgi:1-acyl-sn-glycerol-3-phosphate acyltransferase